MHLKILITLCLTLSLVLPSANLIAQVVTPAHSELGSSLLQLHRDIKMGVGSLELMENKAPDLIQQTQLFLSRTQNEKWLKSEQGLELKKHQQMLVNFMAVKKHLDKCVKNKESKRKLDERVLDSSFQMLKKTNDFVLPCSTLVGIPPLKDYKNLTDDILRAMKKTIVPDFHRGLSAQVIINNAKAMLGFKLKFDPSFSLTAPTESDLDKIISNVCEIKSATPRNTSKVQNICKNISATFVTDLKQKLKSSISTLRPIQKLTPELATNSLNLSIDKLNTTLKKISLKKDVGFFFDSADLKDEAAKKSFDQYINTYMNEIQNDAGPLLLSSRLKKISGSIKSFEDSETVQNKKNKKFEFSEHKKIKIDDVKLAIKETEAKLEEHNQRTLKQSSTAHDQQAEQYADQDAELVKTNPIAAGQLVIQHPEYTGLLCDSINKVNENDKFDDEFDKYFTVGAAVLGGALLLTGIGTVAGAYLLTGSVSAGVAVGTVGGTVLGYSALAASAVEIASAGYFGKKAYDHYQEMNQLEAAFMTQNGDTQSILESKNALIEFKEARMTAGISLASVGLSLANAGRFFNILKFNQSKVGPDEIKAATKIMNYLSQSQIAKKIKEVSSMMTNPAIEKIDLFFSQLAKVSEINRVKFLEYLSNKSTTPQKIKEVIEEALLAAKSCKV
jgi:hypothetical protein